VKDVQVLDGVAGLDMFDFAAPFRAGFKSKEVSFYTVTMGELVLPTGRIVACDPLVGPDTHAFARTVVPGSYPVALSIAVMPTGDERIGFAMLRLSEAQAVTWEMALLPGEDLGTLEEGEFFGYGVDAGLGCFMDVEAQRSVLARWDALTPEQNYYDDVLESELGKNYKATRDWTLHQPEPARPANVAVFSSGWGDGSYPSWFGLDASGGAVALVTEFQLIDLE